MIVESPRNRAIVNGGLIVECVKTTFIYWFDNDCHVS
jgi:hypothetical protein